MQDGYQLGQKILLQFIANATAGASTNYWGILNDLVGTYPNNALGYLYRSQIVVEGGVANIGLDAIYPTLTGNPCRSMATTLTRLRSPCRPRIRHCRP